MYDLYTKKDRWNREAPMGTTGEQLRNAMYRMHGLRVFFTNGYYDTATHIGIIYYMLNHAGLPMDRVSLKGYPSGHMIYIGEDNVKTLSDDVLRRIGRRHTTAQTLEAFRLARACGMDNINMDLIAGLPGDTVPGFRQTLDGVLALSPESITVHTLAPVSYTHLDVYKRQPSINGRLSAPRCSPSLPLTAPWPRGS